MSVTIKAWLSIGSTYTYLTALRLRNVIEASGIKLDIRQIIIRQIIKNREKYSGCTVHLVSPKLDSGKIIMQKKVRVFKSDTPETISKRILKQEHILYPKAIKKIYSNY